MSNYDSGDGNVVLTYSVDSPSTTAESGDYSYSPTSPNQLTFNSNETQTITITINSDADSDNETLVFNFSISPPNNNNVALRNTQHTITVVDDEKPLIITEIADPNNADDRRYVELYNPSASSISLDGLYLMLTQPAHQQKNFQIFVALRWKATLFVLFPTLVLQTFV